MLPHPAVGDDLARGQQEQVARPVARHVVEDARRPAGERTSCDSLSDRPQVLSAPGHLVEDEGRAATHGGALVGRHHAHRGGVEREPSARRRTRRMMSSWSGASEAATPPVITITSGFSRFTRAPMPIASASQASSTTSRARGSPPAAARRRAPR